MKFWYLLLGVFITAIAFEKSRKYGAVFLVIIVLGMLLTAERKGLVKE